MGPSNLTSRPLWIFFFNDGIGKYGHWEPEGPVVILVLLADVEKYLLLREPAK